MGNMGIPYVQLFMFLCFYHVLSTALVRSVSALETRVRTVGCQDTDTLLSDLYCPHSPPQPRLAAV